MRFDLDEDSMEIITSIISPEINQEEEDIGWEEITYANVTYLIKSIVSGGKGNINVKVH
jgi:hypothetical protein